MVRERVPMNDVRNTAILLLLLVLATSCATSDADLCSAGCDNPKPHCFYHGVDLPKCEIYCLKERNRLPEACVEKWRMFAECNGGALLGCPIEAHCGDLLEKYLSCLDVHSE